MSSLETGTPEFRQHSSRSGSNWTTTIVIVALVLGLAGLGVGLYALATQPAKVSGPTGSQGQTGAQGPQGPQGVEGKQGPAGSVASTTIERGTTKVTDPDPAPGAVLDAMTSCPTGTILLSGGAQVSAPGLTADRNVALRSSFPMNETTWETVALVTGPLGQGVSMSMTPYVICGAQAGSTTTSTSTSSTSAP
jgi:hypothetical protein